MSGYQRIFVLLGLMCHGCCIAGETLVLRTAETQPMGYPTTQALQYMGQKLRQWSNNELSLKLYAGGQLGEEKDTLEITIFGGIDLNRINMAPLNSIAPETVVLGLPFLFRSIDHLHRVIDGDIGDEILASLAPYGLVGLAFYDSGARSFYNNRRPVHSPADLAGLKIRVQNSELAVAMVKALGANPTPMGFGQVYESLLLGTIDGSENNWPSYVTTGHYKVAKFYTLSRHTMTPEVLVMSKNRWQRLSEKHRRLVRKAARMSVPYMREQWAKRVALSESSALAAGVEVTSEPDAGAFVRAVAPVYDQFVTTNRMRRLVARIRAMQ